MAIAQENVLKTTINHPVTISLPANLTTGFAWEIDFIDPVLECHQLSYKKRGEALGAGGIQKFEVRARKSGEYAINFKLKRSWEKNVRETRKYYIIVTERK